MSEDVFPQNHTGELTKELHGYDKKNEVILPQWPANTNIMKNFVGKVCGMKDDDKNIKTIEEIDIELVTKCRHSKFKFNYPVNIAASRISRNRIVKILQDPSQNRRDKIDDIWVFIEEKLQTYIPIYFKRVLKACGFDNGVTISSIEEEDVQHFEQEVDGSTKTIENFEFIRGHKMFLFKIRDFLKTYCEENGTNSLVSELARKVETAKHKMNEKGRKDTVPRKKLKFSTPESSTSTPSLEPDRLKNERNILIAKAITSLISHTPEMYVNARVKDIEMETTKTSTGLVIIEIHKSTSEAVVEQTSAPRYVGKIVCPICSAISPIHHSSTKRINGLPGKKWWNTSGFNRHLKETHQTYNLEDHFNSIDQNMKVTKNSPSANVESVEETKEIDGGTNMLQYFVKSAETNSTRKKQGYRFNILIKMFAAFIKMVAGLLAYETLHANFPLSLPSVSTVNRFLADNGPQIVEGEMRTDELVQYLKNRNLPLQISLSEDATRITPKISYDPKTNQLIGFALPLDKNGMPIASSFPARNVREIQGHFSSSSNSISSYAYVQMGQPIEPNSPPFCCMIYSTDNKFTALNIFKRWQFQANTLKEKGITINNIASDGDTRPLMAMKVLSRIGQQDLSYLDCEWFSCGGFVETTFTQDVIHIITKSRNRILTCSRLFPIGDKIVSSTHLKYLIQNVSKDKHLLTYSDIEPKDRQNFLSAEKVCSERTIQCLRDYVPESEGTIIYLRMMRSVLNAFLEPQITLKERIYEIWYAVFFCRAWRSWLINSEKVIIPGQKRPKRFYNLKDNFMSSNCYTCIELNAHALVKQVLTKDSSEETVFEESSEDILSSKEEKLFFPILFDSQVCESTFRQIRSFTSTYCTVVNFNMLDIIHRIRKIQLQNEIVTSCNGRIKFPRFEKKASNISAGVSHGSHRLESLSQSNVILQIEEAKKAVTSHLEKLGINTSKLDFHCQIQPVFEEDMISHETEIDSDSVSDFEELHENIAADFFDDEVEEEMQEDINFLSGITGELMLREYKPMRDGIADDNSGKIHLDEKSIFVVVADNKGKEKVVRKSAVCYVLSKDKHKISSDRLLRVQEKEYANNNLINKSISDADNFITNQEICIGSWCIFSQLVEDEEIHPVILGLVLEFTYLKGNTFKDREFSKSFAPVESSISKGIGVLCNFYSFNQNGVLSSIAGYKHKFINIDRYIGTIKPPIYENQVLTISPKLAFELQRLNDR